MIFGICWMVLVKWFIDFVFCFFSYMCVKIVSFLLIFVGFSMVMYFLIMLVFLRSCMCCRYGDGDSLILCVSFMFCMWLLCCSVFRIWWLIVLSFIWYLILKNMCILCLMLNFEKNLVIM